MSRRRWLEALVVVGLSVGAEASAASPEPAPPPLFALVIGNNQPLPGSDYDPLQFADDDAIRFAAFFESLGAKVILLTRPDEDTAERYGEILQSARAPTRHNLERAVDEIEAALVEAEGQQPEFFFYFSGHGSVTSSEAYLHLLRDRFARVDLYDLVLRRLPAHRVHVVIDSCHSYFMVNPRGTRVEAAAEEESLDQYPGAGFLLSTSSQREVHEWSGYRGGVFSHQLLGALQGAADVDVDGRVTYSEAHGYLVNANRDVENSEARIRPFVRRPVANAPAVLDLRRARPEARAWVPAEITGHFFVTDQRGARLLDGNKAVGDRLALALPEDLEPVLHVGGLRYAVSRSEDGVRTFSLALSSPKAGLATRGGLADDLRRNLFKRPLTQGFVDGMDAAQRFGRTEQVELRYVAGDWLEDPVTLGLVGSGAAVAATGLAFTFPFLNARREANARPVTQRTADAQARAQRWQAAMIAGYSVGGTALVLGVLRALFVNEGARPSLEVAVTPLDRGLAVSAGGALW